MYGKTNFIRNDKWHIKLLKHVKALELKRWAGEDMLIYAHYTFGGDQVYTPPPNPTPSTPMSRRTGVPR